MKFGQAVARQWYHERISAPTLLPRLTQVTATTQRFVMAHYRPVYDFTRLGMKMAPTC
ncbi:hypothetical protein L3X07_13915 [Levilactobacillus brevis]|nr:hypothetical protein [Levilactobacillus brevis]